MRETVLEVHNLVKTYGEVLAVRDISFQVGTGEVFSLLGPNGAGKTTSLECVTMLRKPTSGTIAILGFDIAKRGSKIIPHIGVLPQEFSLYPDLTSKELVRFFAGLYDIKVSADDLLASVGLEEKANTQYKNLSGGERRRVNIATTLVNSPKILFLDEPTTGLSPEGRRMLWEVIRKLKSENKTIFLTTHYMEEAEALSDTVAIMHRGKLSTLGSPEQIVRDFGGDNKLRLRGVSDEVFDTLRVSLPNLAFSRLDHSVELLTKLDTDVVQVVTLIEQKKLPYKEMVVERRSLETAYLNIVEGGQADAPSLT